MWICGSEHEPRERERQKKPDRKINEIAVIITVILLEWWSSSTMDENESNQIDKVTMKSERKEESAK